MPSGIYSRSKQLIKKITKHLDKCRLTGDKNPAKRLDVRNKIRKTLLGHHVSLETRKKISKANSGINNFWYGKKRPDLSKKLKGIIPWNKGKKMTAEYANKVSLRLMGHKISKETRLKIQKSNKENKVVLHHIYGKNCSNLMKLTRSQHTKLHLNAYFYILEKFGKKEIDNYINWFFEVKDAFKKL